jgi:hypothetical protein
LVQLAKLDIGDKSEVKDKEIAKLWDGIPSAKIVQYRMKVTLS